MSHIRFWDRKFLIIGLALFVSLLIWISYSIAFIPITLQPPEPDGPGVRATESDMPAKEFEMAISRAKDVVGRQYRISNRYRWGSRTCDWIGFGLTSLITVIVGATGRVLQPGQDPAVAVGAGETKLNRQWMRRVGVIAASASIMIGASSRLQSESQSALESGEKLRATIATARKDFNDASTPVDAQTVIDDLEATTSKY